MLAEDLLKAGHLAEAIEAHTEETRAFPTDEDRRHLLFTLLGFSGDLKRARLQADALGTLSPRTESWAQVYRGLLDAEGERRRVHHDGTSPLMPREPPAHVAKRLEALAALRSGEDDTASTALSAATGPRVSGRVDGAPFVSICDGDDALGGVLEVFAGGRYLWMPFERIRKIEIPEPRHLIDTLWTEVRLEDRSGGIGLVYLPVLYEGSWSNPDDRVKLGRVTEWADSLGVAFRGSGQRVLAFSTDGSPEADLRGLLSIRTIELDA